MTKKQKILRIVLIVIALVVIALLLWMIFDTGGPEEIDYQTDEEGRLGLVDMIVDGQVQAVYVNGYTAYVLTVDQQMTTADFLRNPTSNAKYFCYMPYSYALSNTVYHDPETDKDVALSSMITLRYANAQSNSTLTSLIVPIVGVIVIGIIIFFIFRQSAGARAYAFQLIHATPPLFANVFQREGVSCMDGPRAFYHSVTQPSASRQMGLCQSCPFIAISRT